MALAMEFGRSGLPSAPRNSYSHLVSDTGNDHTSADTPWTEQARPSRGTEFRVFVNLPNGERATLFGKAGMNVETLIQPLVVRFGWQSYKVIMSKSKAPVNTEWSSAELDGTEIDIVEIGAMRLRIVEQLLSSEQNYLETMQKLMSTYAEPLRKWHLHKVSHKVLFGGIPPLIQLSEDVIFELERAVKKWNPDKTCIGAIFTGRNDFWDVFEQYANSYTSAAQLLKKKRSELHDSSGFTAFIDAQRGNSVHTLESLLLVPNQRLPQYSKMLLDLLELTPEDHHDYHDLKKAKTDIEQLLARKTEDLMRAENQAKLVHMQERFSQPLFLNRPLSFIPPQLKRKKSMHRPSYDYLESCGDVMESKSSAAKLIALPTPLPDSSQLQSFSGRQYVQEGPVHLTSMATGLTKERYMFFLSDLIIIAKRKTPTNHSAAHFHLKDRLRLSEVWVSACPDDLQTDLSYMQLEPHHSFVIGWPCHNHVATFSTPKEKELWYSLLCKHIDAQKGKDCPPNIQLKVYNKATINGNVVVARNITVTPVMESDETVRRALEIFLIEDDPSRYQITVNCAGRDDLSMPLIGPERPYAIKMNSNRQQLDSQQVETQPVQFHLRTCLKVSYFPVDTAQNRSTRKLFRQTLKTSVSSTLVNVNRLFRTNKPTKEVTGSKGVQCKPVFGQPLDKIISGDEVPQWLEDVLVKLYLDGPECVGILRKSPNVRMVREMRESLESGVLPQFEVISVLAVGSFFKEFLRAVPGCILNSKLYTEWVACIDPPEDDRKIKMIKRMLERLSPACQLLLHYVFVILEKISLNSDLNQMHAENIAICVSPSLLWPADEMRVLKNEVPPLVHFIIEHTKDIFGADPMQLVAAVEKSQARGHGEEEERASKMSGSSADDILVDDEDEYGGTLKGSSLTASDSQLYVADDEGTSSPGGSTSPAVMRRQSGMKTVGHTSEPSSPLSTLARPVQEQARHLPRSRLIYQQAGDGMAARTAAANWRHRLSESSADWSKAGQRAQGSAMQVIKHRMSQAAARAEQAQQAAPPSPSHHSAGQSRRSLSSSDKSDDPKAVEEQLSPNRGLSRMSRTQLHPSATAFMDKLSMGQSPGLMHRHPSAGLDLEKAEGARSFQELYAVYSMEGMTGRSSVSLPTTPNRVETTPLSQSFSGGPSPKSTRSSASHRQGLEPRQPVATVPLLFRNTGTSNVNARLAAQYRSPASVAEDGSSLMNAISESLGMVAPMNLSTPIKPDHSPASLMDSSSRQHIAMLDSSSSSSESSSDDENGGGIAAAHPTVRQTRTLEKSRPANGSIWYSAERSSRQSTMSGLEARGRPASLGVSISSSRIQSFSTKADLMKPRRVTTRSYDIPGPAQAKFEETNFDQESFV